MPSYSVRTTNYHGAAVLEILCDRKEWSETHPYDEHFRFGPLRARMIVTAKAVIREFLESEGHKPPKGRAVVARDDTREPAFSVACCNYDHFMRRRRRMDQPYLKLRFSRYTIGFGLSKAEALIALMNQIEAFANKHDV